MDKIFLVYDEYCFDGVKENTIVIPCTTFEIAKQVLKKKLEWYLKNTYINRFVDENLNLCKEYLDDCDVWNVEDDSIEIYIYCKDTRLDLHIAEEYIINTI